MSGSRSSARRRLVAALLGAAATLAAPAGAQVNVALNKPVTLNGTFGVLRPGSVWAPAPAPAAASTVVDGVFRPEGTTWTDGTVWWDAQVSGSHDNSIVIDLGSVFHISAITLQADNNDQYTVEYRTNAANPWTPLGFFLAQPGFGMVTRGPSAIVFDAREIRLAGASGDQYYSISEFQAFSAVPEPATFVLSATGIGLLAGASALRRRREGTHR